MRGGGWGRAWAAAALAGALCGPLAGGSPTYAGHALVDAQDGTTLELTEPHRAIAAEQALDLLLVEVVRERIAAGTLRFGTPVPMTVVAGDGAAAHAAHGTLPAGELLQLVLLNRSRTAVASLANAVGPGWERTRARLRQAAARLALTDTVIPERWPSDVSAAAHTTIADLVRLASAVVRDGDLRRRLALDGSPIADGALIVRATDPLIACTAPSGASPAEGGRTIALGADPAAALAYGSRDGLDLLAVAAGDDAGAVVWRALDDGFIRYRHVELVHAGAPVGAEIEVAGGAIRGFTAVAAQPFALTVPRSGPFTLSAWLQLPARVQAPIEANQAIGELVFAQGATIVAAVPLVAPAAIAPSGWIDTAQR